MPELERTTSEAMVSAKNGCQVGNFTRLKQEEKNIIVKGQESVPLLLDQLFEIEREINAKRPQNKHYAAANLSAPSGALSALGSGRLRAFLYPNEPLEELDMGPCGSLQGEVRT
jgi:hypothetical protein